MDAEKPLARPDEPKPVWKLLITGSPRLLNAHRQGLRSRCALGIGGTNPASPRPSSAHTTPTAASAREERD